MTCPNCAGTGIDPILYSCCGDDITDNDILICPSCKEHCGDEHEQCEECGGDGTIDLLCTACNGSGEGQHDGSSCNVCKGSGVQN